MTNKDIKIVTIKIELVVPANICGSSESIAEYLNNKLYMDPEFFGDFGPENIEEVKDTE